MNWHPARDGQKTITESVCWGESGEGREWGFRRGAGVTHQLGCSPGLDNFCTGPVRDGGWGRGQWKGGGRGGGAGELSIPVPSLNYHNKFGNFVLFIYQGQDNKGSCWSLFWRHHDKAPDRSSHVLGDEQTPLRRHLIILSQYLEAKITLRKTIADANHRPVDKANGDERGVGTGDSKGN